MKHPFNKIKSIDTSISNQNNSNFTKTRVFGDRLNPNTPEEGGSNRFLKNVSSTERVEPWFFVTFNIILKHIFPENFIEFPQVVQKI